MSSEQPSRIQTLNAPSHENTQLRVGEAAQGMAIDVCNLGKCYRLYARPKDRLLQMFWGRRRQFYREMWALRDINLQVERGKTIGILGANGSGKSTLLQIIAGTLTPSTGHATVHGRVSALLELGSGFNPEFTGRENVYLNASILGLSHEEITNRFDMVAGFAEIGSYMDCPLKTYSSGMAVRLAFSVAISVDPDVLLVDEALAVGDLRFQHRCMSRIRELKDRGVSILFVTHDLDAAKRLCDRIYVLDGGKLVQQGPPDQVANWYLAFMTGQASPPAEPPPQADAPGESAPERSFVRFQHGDGRATVTAVDLLDRYDQPVETALMDDTYTVRISVEFKTHVSSPVVGFYLRDRLGTNVIGVNTWQEGFRLPAVGPGDVGTVTFRLPLHLRPDHYSITAGIAYSTRELRYLDWVDHALVFEIIDPEPTRAVDGLTHPLVEVGVHVAHAEKNSTRAA